MKNIIRSVDSDSPLAGKVRPGDSLVAVNGNPVNDVLDYKYYAYDSRLKLTFARPDGNEYELKIRKNEGGEPGLNFEDYLMDRPRSCANNCIFCFIDQLPRGMRKTMYFKDDDARLSFLMGNYITLTNLSQREIQRIKDLHISPINVSVHTTDPGLRREMLRNPRAGECYGIMSDFAAAGIVMNCQIVCCPGYNDGEELLRTMRDLEALYPQVHSVSVVPVGLTKFREGLTELKPFTAESAAELLDSVTAFGDGCLERHGSRIFFCGDELYLLSGRKMPEDSFYEEYTQLENGVGMMRLLETEFISALRLADEPDGVPFSIVTGVSAAPYFRKLMNTAAAAFPQLKARVYGIENRFFGPGVNVAGLLTGGDVIEQLSGKELGERVFISQNMLRRQEMDFLDDVSLKELSEKLGVPVYPVEQDGFALWDAISGTALNENNGGSGCEDNCEYYRYNPDVKAGN